MKNQQHKNDIRTIDSLSELEVMDAGKISKSLSKNPLIRNSWAGNKKETGDVVLSKVKAHLENKGWTFHNIGTVKRKRSSLPTGQIIQVDGGNFYLILGCRTKKGEIVDLGYNDGISVGTGYIMRKVPRRTPKDFPTIKEDHLVDMAFFRSLDVEIKKEKEEEAEFFTSL